MLYGPMDPNERFRSRRDRTRRTKRRRRAAVLGLLLIVVIAVAMGARFVGDASDARRRTTAAAASRHRQAPLGTGRQPEAAAGRDPRHSRHRCARLAPRQVPRVHRLQELRPEHDRARRQGRGRRDRLHACRRAARARGRRDTAVLQPEGARRPRPPERHLHDRPRCLLPGSDARAARDRTSRSSGRTAASGRRSAGLGWVNPYDRRVWDYCVSVAEAAAKAGFDQIMFDYVRFPSDGDVDERRLSGPDERLDGAA